MYLILTTHMAERHGVPRIAFDQLGYLLMSPGDPDRRDLGRMKTLRDIRDMADSTYLQLQESNDGIGLRFKVTGRLLGARKHHVEEGAASVLDTAFEMGCFAANGDD